MIACGDDQEVIPHDILHQSTLDDVALDAVAVTSDGTVLAVGGRSYEFGYIVRNTTGGQEGPKRFFTLQEQDSTWVATGIDGYWYELTDSQSTAIDRSPIFKPIRDFAFDHGGDGLAVSVNDIGTWEIYTLGSDFSTSIDTVLEHELLGVSTACGGIVCGYGGLFKQYATGWQYKSTPADFYSDIAVADEGLYAVGLGGQVINSNDCGETWTSVYKTNGTLSQLPQLEAIAYRDGYFAIAGDDAIITSTDGSNWQVYTTDTPYHFSDVAISHDKLYLTTYGGALIAVDRP